MAMQTLAFDGELLRRGFWLYVWEITPKNAASLYYVGRTGDNPSPKAQSPFVRMGQHFGKNKNANALRKHLEAREIDPARCGLRLFAHGPIFDEVSDYDEHKKRRDVAAALEKALEESLRVVGYDVLNVVNSNMKLDKSLFKKMIRAFNEHLPKLLTKQAST